MLSNVVYVVKSQLMFMLSKLFALSSVVYIVKSCQLMKLCCSPGNMFTVVPASDDCRRIRLEGRYNLYIGPDTIQLCVPDSATVLQEWDYRHLRDFGFSSTCFFFKSGTRSATGVGYFSFQTPEGQIIMNLVQQTTAKLKDRNDNNLPQSKPRPPPPQPHPKPKLQSSVSTVSNDSSISSSSNQKIDKKEQKRLEKLRKKEEEERRKEEKEREKAAKKEKKIKKPQTPPPPPPEPVESIYEDALYATADAVNVDTTSVVTKPVVTKPPLPAGAKPKPKPYQNSAAPQYNEQVYSDPWENKPLPSPTFSSNSYPDESVEEMYAVAEKGRVNRTVPLLSNDYEDLEEENLPAPVVPAKAYVDDSEDTYEHLGLAVTGAPPPQDDNIYGLASAKPMEPIYEQSKYPNKRWEED